MIRVQIKSVESIPKRNSPNDIKNSEDLNRLNEIVVDKLNAKRAHAKKTGGIATTKSSL